MGSKGPLGISGTLTARSAPVVQAGHVAAWVGVGGPNEAPDGTAEWLQVGMNSAHGSTNNHLYYEYARPGIPVTYVQLAANIPVGQSVRVAVLKTATGRDLWRVWVDGKPVSPAIHLPGSHGAWYPQAVAENWNGGTGTCNTYAYRFSDVKLAQTNGGVWQSLKHRYLFEDAGYQVVQTSRVPSNFVATSLS